MTPRLPADFIEAIGDGPMGVAVSGGSDSLALLVLLLDAGVQVQVATVHHHLRPEAGDEAAAVADFCATRGIPHTILNWQWDGAGNLQDSARRGRYALLADWAAAQGLGHVALGHTADDNVETFVMGLSRGAGLDGLSGMRPQFMQGGTLFQRPLLEYKRNGLREMLRGRNIPWIEDPSNDDPKYHRVRVRQALVALGRAGVAPDALGQSLSNLRQTRRDVTLELRHALQGRWQTCHGDVLVDLSWLQQSTLESRRRVLQAAIRVVSGQDYAPRGDKLGRLAMKLEGQSTLQGCVFTGEGQHVRVTREHAMVAAMHCSSDGIWDQRWVADGPHTDATELRVLGEAGIAACPDGWRGLGLPRVSVLASPAVWEGATLRSAPHAGWVNGWKIKLRDGAPDLNSSILLH